MKYLRQMICMIFLTIVITILSNYKVNALTINGIDFPEFPGDNNDSYVLYYSSSSYNDGIPFGYNLVTFNKDNIKYVNFQVRSSVTRLGFYKDFCFDDCSLYDVKTDEEDYKVYNLNNSSWKLKTKTSDKNQFKPSANTILSSNITIYVSDGTYDNSTLYKSDENVVSTRIKNINGNYTQFTINPPTRLEDIKNHVVYSPMVTEPIEINFEFLYLDENGTEFTDMNGNIYKKLKVKFGDVYNENYKYMISFDNKNWFDVSKQFKQNDDSYIPNAYFNIPISSTIYAKVTKKDDTLISENSIAIELDKTLEKVGYINNEYMNLKYVEFEIDNILQGFSPTRFAVQYGTNSDVSNMPNYLKYEVIIEDKNQNPINIDLNEYYFFKESSLQYKDKIKGVVLDIININHKIPSNAENLKVRFYFNNTEDYYMNFYTTNPKFNTKIDYYDDFFSNYKKYKFPKGYTKAIIKPINKNSSNGNVLFMKTLTNSDIDFFYYDFNSYSITKNIFETAQRDLTEYVVEGYNDVFRKYDFSIDVENKIYPIIHNKREKYCLGGQDIKEDYNFISGWSKKQCEVSEVQHVFYLPNDYYVEFVNLETDSKIVKNISDEDFGKDDTLDINDNFKDQMNEKYPFYNEENNKLLNKLNNYIEQLKSMYLDYFPFIGQLKEIYDIFNTNISEDTEPPNWTINVEFKPLGIKYENLKVIDFSFFEEYKELLFNFEKLFLGLYTIIGIVNNIKKGSV